MKVTPAHRQEGPLGASDKAHGPKEKARQAPPISGALRHAYRATFEEYAAKLNVLQSLVDGNGQSEQIDAATVAVEQARLAYSCARDRLAKELMHLCKNPGNEVSEQQIRRTARLIWEFSGRPEGTAERDWQQAEKLVCAGSGC